MELTENSQLKSGEEGFAVELENVTFSYGEGEEPALKNLSLKVRRGEHVAILGHNGSGKSTLARLINGLLSPDEGKISVLGLDASDRKNLFEIRKNAGIVFQNPDNQTVASIVEDDVAFGPENVGIEREEIGKRIDFALHAVGMEEYRRAETACLSGGQKQRVAIAGVLALKPKIMILDESTAMLDPKGRKEVIEIVEKLNKEEGITVISITHFPEEAFIADRAVVLYRGELVAEGTSEEILKDEEKLTEYRLSLPRPVRICRTLRSLGVDVADSMDAEAIAESIGTSGAKSFIQEEKEEKGGERAPSVLCKNLFYSYDGAKEHALRGVDVEIKAGEFFGIAGHTGSGKSTFVRHLNALEKLPQAHKKYREKKRKKGAGEIEKKTVLQVGGYDLADKNTDFFALRSKVGMVFQYPEYQLFAETVYADVAFGLRNFSKTPLEEKDVQKAVKEALETVGLCYEEVKDKSPFELSGGQKRRVAIAGVIVTKPKILVLDEPAAGLDPLGKQAVATLLKKVHEEWCETVIVVSHDMDEIADTCDRVAVFSEGKIAYCDTPRTLFSEKADELLSLGLDIPVTAKIQKALQKRGIEIRSDLTERGFTQAVALAAGVLKRDEKRAEVQENG